MRSEYQKYQLIDDYLNNKLSDKETMEFEQVMKQDPEFREEVFDQKLANDIIIENRFFEVVGNIEATVSTSAKAGLSTSIKAILGITISAGIALVVGLYFIKTETSEPVIIKSNNQKIANKDTKENIPSSDNNIKVLNKEKTTPIVDNNNADNFNLGKQIPESKKEIKTKANDNSEKNNGTYILEIPLETNNQEAFTFNPIKGESWQIPLKGNQNATLRILDKTGKEVFRTKITEGYPNHWKGTSGNNSILEQGNYIYILDFGNGAIEHGYLSITNQ